MSAEEEILLEVAAMCLINVQMTECKERYWLSICRESQPGDLHVLFSRVLYQYQIPQYSLYGKKTQMLKRVEL